MQAGDPHIVDPPHVGAHHLGRHRRLLSHRKIAGSGAEHGERTGALALARRCLAQRDNAGHRVILRFRDQGFHGGKRSLIGAGRQHIAAHRGHAKKDLSHLRGGLTGRVNDLRQSGPQAAMMVNLGEAGFFVGQLGQALHGLLRPQFSIAHALQHREDGLSGHDRAPVVAICRVRHAFIAACMTVFSGTSKAAAARRQSSNSGAAFHSSPCHEPVLI